MAKVYVITAGEYSCYHICAVALDLETAERLKRLHSTYYDEAMIEEFDTTEPAAVSGEIVPIYSVKIYTDSTVICNIDHYVLASEPFTPEFEIREDWNRPPLIFVMKTKARDSEHAIKIAADAHAKAMNEYLIEHGETIESLALKISRKKTQFSWHAGTATAVLTTVTPGGS